MQSEAKGASENGPKQRDVRQKKRRAREEEEEVGERRVDPSKALLKQAADTR